MPTAAKASPLSSVKTPTDQTATALATRPHQPATAPVRRVNAPRRKTPAIPEPKSPSTSNQKSSRLESFTRAITVATAFTTDWYRRFFPDADDHRRLRVARIATVTIGVVGTGAAVLMAGLNDPSLLDVWFEVLGLFGSGVAGVFLLGALTRRTGPVAGWCGLVASAATVWSVGAYTNLSGLAYSAVGIVACLVVGLAVGLFGQRDLASS